MIKMLLAALLVLQSEIEFKRAEEKLVKDPDDPSANLVVGRFYLLKGDPEKGIPFLRKCSEASLKKAAQAEADVIPDNALAALEVGDLWTQALSKNRPLRQSLLDRASFWYAKAWPELGDLYKLNLQERLRKLYAPVIPGKAGGLPEGWGGPVDVRHKAEVVNTISHSGGACVRLKPWFVAQSASLLRSSKFELKKGSKEIEFSAWVLSDGTNNGGDQLVVYFTNEDGKLIKTRVFGIRRDVPVWVNFKEKIARPDDAVFVSIAVIMCSTDGFVLVDDVSVRADGEECVKNGGFESR